jgi:hypothetical protein
MTSAIQHTHAAPKPPRRRLRASASPMAHAFTIPDAQSMGAPGRTKIYALAKDGRLKLLHVAGRTLVDGDSLRALLSEAATAT